jgi:hypothetical protein
VLPVQSPFQANVLNSRDTQTQIGLSFDGNVPTLVLAMVWDEKDPIFQYKTG